ncbi:PilN domain-containing protein [Clostridium taeniosporum]|uniref:Fimbrial protein n=1 Tax=Clostridium taeniosporum TaxID=394958 RepID=A0A1D7XMS2_9CLOT|nr:PilN domain-containing protein [Clostridium taeniosporum]AOR24626.1 fimbrial protein [Clostridium taeniosporum]
MRDINFFAPYKGKDKEKKSTLLYIYGVMGVIGGLIIITLIFNSVRIFILNKNISYYEEQLNNSEIKQKFSEAEKINDKISTLTKYNDILDDVVDKINNRNNVSDLILNDVNSTIPSQISFKNLQISNDILTIQGITSSRDAVGEFQHNLRELSMMKDVFVNSIDIDDSVEGQYSFDIKCVLAYKNK